MRVFDISERLACRLVGLARSAFRRPLKGDTPDDPDRALRAWLRAYARKHARWGYRRATVAAREDGWAVTRREIQRLWGEEGLRVVVRRHRKRVGVSDLPTITQAAGLGDAWAIDFPFDKAMAGKPFKILSIIDEHTREALGGKVEYSITAEDLIERGMPKALRMDNGPKFISKALREWAIEVDLVFIPPAQPWRNGFIESFNGRIRDECLSVNQFCSLSHAKGIIGIWKEDYNTTRPHSSRGYLAPAVYAEKCTP